MVQFCKRCQKETERRKDGRCKPCRGEYDRKYDAANKEKRLAYQRKYNAYDRKRRCWPPGLFEAKLQLQRGRCAICGKSLEKTLGRGCRDHCHTTYKPREVLCVGCNTDMGVVDSPHLVRLLEYRDRWRHKHEQGLV